MQISAFGDDDNSDASDLWIVQWDKGGNFWLKDQKVGSVIFLGVHHQFSGGIVLQVCLRPKYYQYNFRKCYDK